MIILELGEEKYKVKRLGELTYQEYNILMDILDSEEVDEYHKIKSVLSLLTEIKNTHLISNNSLDQIDYKMLLEPPKEVYKETYPIGEDYVNGVTINKPMIDLDNINFGKYIDLDYFQEEPITLTTLMLDSYDNINELNKAKERISAWKYEDILTITQYYYKWKNNLLESYGTLFEVDEEDEEIPEEEQEKNETSLMDIVRSLSNGDILKVNPILELKVREVFNWLSYMKELNDKEKTSQQNKTIYH